MLDTLKSYGCMIFSVGVFQTQGDQSCQTLCFLSISIYLAGVCSYVQKSLVARWLGGLPKKRQGATRSDTKCQEAFKQFLMLKMSK